MIKKKDRSWIKWTTIFIYVAIILLTISLLRKCMHIDEPNEIPPEQTEEIIDVGMELLDEVE
jgi:hypothetical protein